MKRIQKTQQILETSAIDLNRMTAAELRANVQILASAANKRLARLGQSEIGQLSPAYISAMKRSYTGEKGGKFGTKGKSRNQLLSEFAAIRSFMGLKTSTGAGWRSVREKSFRRAGIKPSNDPEKEKLFWKTYRKIEKMFPNSKSMAYGSSGIQSDLRRVMNGSGLDETLDQINDHFKDQFDVVTDENGDEISTSDLPEGDMYLITEDGSVIFDLDPDDPEDLLKIMEMKVSVEYEVEQYSADDDEFFELENRTPKGRKKRKR